MLLFTIPVKGLKLWRIIIAADLHLQAFHQTINDICVYNSCCHVKPQSKINVANTCQADGLHILQSLESQDLSLALDCQTYSWRFQTQLNQSERWQGKQSILCSLCECFGRIINKTIIGTYNSKVVGITVFYSLSYMSSS